MENIFDYLLKVSSGLALVYTFYHLVLRRLTFYRWNRIYLLSHSVLCFFIPLIDVSAWMNDRPIADLSMVRVIPPIGIHPTDQPSDIYFWLMGLFIIGLLFFGVRLITQYFSLNRIIRQSALIYEDKRIRLFQSDRSVNPFSFGRSVFLNSNEHTSSELESIIEHEIIHIREKHSADLIVAELICMLNWFNPFAWLIRSAIRQNLEFIADSRVLDKGYDRTEYQYLLLKVSGLYRVDIANHFSFSNLKNRIIMINRIKSAKLHLARFLFALPLLAVIVLSFRTETSTVVPHNLFVSPKVVSDTTAPRLPLVIIDGKTKPLGFDPKTVPSESIESINVLKGKTATEKYGKDAKEGAIEIITKNKSNVNADLKNREKDNTKNADIVFNDLKERVRHHSGDSEESMRQLDEMMDDAQKRQDEAQNMQDKAQKMEVEAQALQDKADRVEQDQEGREESEQRLDIFREEQQNLQQGQQQHMRLEQLEQFRKLQDEQDKLKESYQQLDLLQKQKMLDHQNDQLNRLREQLSRQNEDALNIFEESADSKPTTRELTELDVKRNQLDQRQIKLRQKLEEDMNKLVSDYEKKIKKLNTTKEKLDR